MLELITGVVGVIIYPLLSIIFLVIDLLQGVFYGLAGIGDIKFNMNSTSEAQDFFSVGTTIGSTNDGGETSTGLIYYLLTSDLIKNLFMSILILALFLIIIFTAMAFIKNAYASKQKTWQEIVGNAFKGLANFIFIPVCCLLGVWLSNILLQAINAATSTGGAVKMSRKLFICCAYDANHYRNKSEIGIGDIEDIKTLIEECDDVEITFDAGHDKKDVEYFANVVDTVYAQTSDSYASIHWWWTVQRHYSLFNINYLIMGVGGGFMLVALLAFAFAMIKRLFILLMLFVISPAICAMYPIDDGSAVGNWKKEFIKYTISAYGSVAALNLFFSILPIIENINIIGVEGLGFLMNDVFQLLIMVCGLFVVKEFMGTLSGWIGGDNAMATGESLRKQAKDSIKKKVTGIGGGAVGVFAKAKGARQAGGSFFGSLSKQALEGIGKSSGISEIFDKGRKSYQEGETQVYDSTKEKNIRKISKIRNTDDMLNAAKSAGVEKEISEVVARRINAQRIRNAGRNDIVSMMTGEQLLENKKTVKAEQDARKEFVKASRDADTARQRAAIDFSSRSATDYAGIGGQSFVLKSLQNRQMIDIQEGMTDSDRQLVVAMNKHIAELQKADSKLESAGDKYVESAKAVSDIKNGIVDQRLTRLRVGGVGPANKDDIQDAMKNFMENSMQTLNDSFTNIDLAFTNGVQSLQRFSASTLAVTDAQMRAATTINEGSEIIKQTQRKK